MVAALPESRSAAKERENLATDRAEFKAFKLRRAIFFGKMTRRNMPVIHGFNFARPKWEVRENF